MITKDSQAYRILSLVAVSGECSDDALALLLPQESYRQKVLHRLLEDKLLSKYQKEEQKGFRLMRKGKKGLLQLDKERFSFYLEDGADFSMRRTKLSQRQRQHRISETLAMMERAGIPIYRDQKYPIFEKEVQQAEAFSQAAFFHPKEVKIQTDLTRKIISSRMSGVWLSSDAVWLCYNMGASLPKWFENVESRADILIRSMLRMQGMELDSTNALLFGSSMTQAALCLEDAKMRAYILHTSFRRFCFVPLNDKGCTLLKLLGDAESYGYLFSVLSEDLQPEASKLHLEHDGYNQRGQPTLICVDCDLKRLVQFKTQLDYLGRQGEVICFDFQKEAIERYCGEETTIATVDFETVREKFLDGG